VGFRIRKTVSWSFLRGTCLGVYVGGGADDWSGERQQTRLSDGRVCALPAMAKLPQWWKLGLCWVIHHFSAPRQYVYLHLL